MNKVSSNLCPPKPMYMGAQKTFHYSSDFDTGGLLYYLGTKGNTQGWTNPGIAGIVGVSASSTGTRSERIGMFVGRTATRTLTKDEKNADMSLDLKGVRMNVTRYTLRHYVSQSAHYLRDWNLEGSIDGNNWCVLKEHCADTGITGAGGTHTWTVSNPGWFQHFRIIMTGPNSTTSYSNLCCSGIELYGHAVGGLVSNPPGPSIMSSGASAVSSGGMSFVHQSDFDTNGVLYFLGTKGGTQGYESLKYPSVCDWS